MPRHRLHPEELRQLREEAESDRRFAELTPESADRLDSVVAEATRDLPALLLATLPPGSCHAKLRRRLEQQMQQHQPSPAEET